MLRRMIGLGVIFLVIFVFTFLGIGSAEAAMNPAPPFCERQGYSVTPRENGTEYCDFGDGNKCEIWEFYNGECGKEYSTGNFPCVEEGNPVFNFDQCCEGLEPHLKCMYVGQQTCRQIPNIFVKIWEAILCMFGIPS